MSRDAFTGSHFNKIMGFIIFEKYYLKNNNFFKTFSFKVFNI